MTPPRPFEPGEGGPERRLDLLDPLVARHTGWKLLYRCAGKRYEPEPAGFAEGGSVIVGYIGGHLRYRTNAE